MMIDYLTILLLENLPIIILIILIYFRKKYKYTLISYSIFLVLFYIYWYFFINLKWLDWNEKWAIWLSILPYILSWIILLIVIFYFDYTRKD